MSEPLPVLAALSAVMEDVQAVGKTGRNTQQNYSFRGVDAVVNAVGPALRKHGVIVVPVSTSAEVEHYETSKGTPMRGVTLKVRFRFYGPAGDHIDAEVQGEASDSGDKATPKAHSVAYRTLLLQALCIPTDEPDPDAESHTRSVPVQASANGGEKATATQKKRMGALISEADKASMPLPDPKPPKPAYESWDDYSKRYANAHFGVSSRADLTKDQMSQLINHLVEATAPF